MTTCSASAATPAEQVEEHELHRAHGVLDVVAEDPQEQHVAAEVQQAAVHEHGGEDRQRTVGASVGRPALAISTWSPGCVISYGIAAQSCELADVVRRVRVAEREPALLPEEVDEDVRRDQRVRDVRRPDVGMLSRSGSTGRQR